jgi:glycosyltransferase involved in cell wall biosynthesis
MACARPVIAMNFGGPAEVVDDSVGRLVDADDEPQAIADLSTALLDVGEHPQAWVERGLHGRRRIEADHTWPARMAQADALYQRLTRVEPGNSSAAMPPRHQHTAEPVVSAH